MLETEFEAHRVGLLASVVYGRRVGPVGYPDVDVVEHEPELAVKLCSK